MAEGRLPINSDGSYILTPSANFNGDVPDVSYTVSDGINTDTPTLTINVVPNTPPIGEDDSFTVDQGGKVIGNVISHDDGDGNIDHDGDGGDLSITKINGQLVTSYKVDSQGYSIIDIKDENGGHDGTLLMTADGKFEYTDTGFFINSKVSPLPGFTLYLK